MVEEDERGRGGGRLLPYVVVVALLPGVYYVLLSYSSRGGTWLLEALIAATMMTMPEPTLERNVRGQRYLDEIGRASCRERV